MSLAPKSGKTNCHRPADVDDVANELVMLLSGHDEAIAETARGRISESMASEIDVSPQWDK